MRYEWYLVTFKDGEFLSRCPYAMGRREAESLLKCAEMRRGENKYEAMHRSQVRLLDESVGD